MRFRQAMVAFSFLMVAAIAPDAAAQTVNAEELTRDVEGFALELSGAFALRRGNVTLTDVGGAAHGQYQTLWDGDDPDDETPPFVRQRWFAHGSARYASDSTDAIVSQSFAHARWTAMWLRRLGSELFAQHQFNEFQRLQARVLAGLGARALLVHHENLRVSLGTGYMAEYERLTPTAAGNASPESISNRWTSFLNARLSLYEERLVLQNIVYVQPRFDAFSDYRLLEEFEVSVAVNDALSLGTAVTVAHDSAPPAGVESTDLAVMQTIKLSF